jgi:hypothetical protein
MPENDQSLDLTITVGDATFHAHGPSDVVMQALAEFKVLAAAAPPPKQQPQRRRQPEDDLPEDDDDDGDRAAVAPPQTSAASKLPLPKFLERDAIKGNPAFATAIVVWAADHEGKDALTRREIEAYWKGTSRKLPANPSRDIGGAVKSGWLVKGEGNTYSASGYGREAIGLA